MPATIPQAIPAGTSCALAASSKPGRLLGEGPDQAMQAEVGGEDHCLGVKK